MDAATGVPESDGGAEASPADSRRNTRPAPRGTAAYQRKRAVKACQVCRARRTKCDNLKPSCSFCLKVGATCIQSPEDLSSFDPASLKILERLDNLEQLLKGLSPYTEEPARKSGAVMVSEHISDANQRSPAELHMILPPSLEHVLSWPVFQSLKVGLQSMTGARADRPDRKVQAYSPPGLPEALEEPRLVKILLDNFFSYVHVKNPILDEPSTRLMVLSKAVDGIGFDWSPESCLSLLICALGSLSSPFGPSLETMPGTTAYSNAQAYFQAAQIRLGVLLASDDIIAPQCLFLSGVFMMCSFQSAKAWRYFVQAVGGCQQFDFLTPQPNASSHSIVDEYIHERLSSNDTLQQAIYWSSWKSERELRGELRLPDFLVSDHDTRLYPSFFPTPPAPRADIKRPNSDAGQTREQISWYFYLAEISLRRLAARLSAEMVAIKEIHTSRHAFLQAMTTILPSHEAQVNEWKASLPPCLSFEAPAEDDDVCRFVLRGHVINLYETMYWPFLSAFLDLKSSNYVSEMRFAETAQKGLDHHMIRLIVNKPGYKHRHHGTSPLLRSCCRSALILMAASIIHRTNKALGLASFNLPQNWQREVGEMVDALDFWSPETNEYNGIRQVLHQGLMGDPGPF